MFRMILALLLLASTPLAAAPLAVTGGYFEVHHLDGGPFRVIGEGFDVTGFAGSGRYEAAESCFRCAIGDSIGADARVSGGDVFGGPGIIGGVFYPFIFLGGADIQYSRLEFSAGPVEITAANEYVFPFSFSGFLGGVEGGNPTDPCLLCQDVFGSGRATLTLTDATEPRMKEFVLLRYEFANIPEPNSAGLVVIAALTAFHARCYARAWNRH